MSRLSAAEAESFLCAFLLFFSREFSDLDDVYIHGVGIPGFGGGGEGVVGLVSRFGVPFGNFFGMIPLGLEGNGLFIPVIDGRGNGVHGHDLTHEGGRDAGGEISNEDILVGDACKGRVVLKVRNILDEGWGISVVLSFGHVFGGEPGSGVMVFECGFKFGDEVREGNLDSGKGVKYQILGQVHTSTIQVPRQELMIHASNWVGAGHQGGLGMFQVMKMGWESGNKCSGCAGTMLDVF